MLGPDDWKQFKLYAWRVRALDMDHIINGLRMSTNGASLLCQSHQNRPNCGVFLPNLENLRISVRDPAEACLLSLLAGPQLRSLSIRLGWSDSESLNPIMKALKPPSPSITSLDLRFWGHVGALTSAAIVKNMPALRDVMVSGPHGSASELVRSLTVAPLLSSLTIKGHTESPSEDAKDVGRRSLVHDTFQSLTTVEADYESLPSVLHPAAIGRILQTLVVAIQLPRAELPAAITTTFDLVGSSCHQLTSFNIAIRAHEDQRNTDTWIKPPKHSSSSPTQISVDPLLSLRGINKIIVHDFSNTLVPSFAAENASRVALAWPRLEHFSWGSTVAATTTTFAVLANFASCESLKCLTLPLDATVQLAEEDLPTFKNRLLLGVSNWVVTQDAVQQIAESIVRLKSDEDGPPTMYWRDTDSIVKENIWYQVERVIRRLVRHAGANI